MKYFHKENNKTKKLVVLLLLLILSLEVNSTANRIKYSNKSLKAEKSAAEKSSEQQIKQAIFDDFRFKSTTSTKEGEDANEITKSASITEDRKL